jgi:hypothetical protein
MVDHAGTKITGVMESNAKMGVSYGALSSLALVGRFASIDLANIPPDNGHQIELFSLSQSGWCDRQEPTHSGNCLSRIHCPKAEQIQGQETRPI